MTPMFETRYMSAFGNIASHTGGATEAITFKKGEKKTFSIDLPKGNTPQSYNLKVSLKGAVSSNTVTVRYIVSGVNGSIDKISLDKDYYSKGDEATMTLAWQSGAGNYARSGTGGSSMPELTLEATIMNEKGNECAKPINQELKLNVGEYQTLIPFEINTNCMNPKVSATMKDKDGNVLDTKEFEFQSNPVNANGKMPMKSVVIGAVALLAVVALGVYMKKKNGDGSNQVA